MLGKRDYKLYMVYAPHNVKQATSDTLKKKNMREPRAPSTVSSRVLMSRGGLVFAYDVLLNFVRDVHKYYTCVINMFFETSSTNIAVGIYGVKKLAALLGIYVYINIMRVRVVSAAAKMRVGRAI